MAGAGIDLGNLNCVLAVARKGGIDVLVNEVSNRATPTMVSFQGEQRHIGEAAANFAMQNFRNTCTDLKCLLALKKDSEEAQEGSKWVNNTLAEGPGGFLGAECSYGKDEKTHVFSYEALTGALLSKLMQIFSTETDTTIKDCVVSVPSYYSDLQRRALQDAAAIGNVKVLRLFSEHAAIALNYGIFRTKELPEEKPLKVAFVDVGQHKTTVSIADFLKSGAKVISVASDKTLGGRDFDALLVNHFAAEFKEKYKIDALSAARPILRLRKACENLKKVLSANAEAPINIECLMDDTDVRGYMKREDFEEMMPPLMERLRAVCEAAIKGAGISDLSEITAVELVGGGTRVPSLKNLVTEVFKQPFKTTLNADEAISRGCALMAAMMSPTVRVREYALTDASPYALSVVKSQEDDMVEGDDIMLVPRNATIPCMKAVSFKNTGSCRLMLRADKSETIADYLVEAPQPAEGDAAKMRVKVKVDTNGVATVHSAVLLVEEEVEVTVPATEEGKATEGNGAEKKEESTEIAEKPEETAPEDKAPEAEAASKEEPATKTKKVKKTKTIELVVKRGTLGQGLPDDYVQKAIEEEAEMKATDAYLKERSDALNAVESYIYESREKLGDYGNLKDFVPEGEREAIMKCLEEAEEWVYSEEAEVAAKSTFVEKRNELFDKVNPIQRRFYEAETRPVEANRLKELCIQYKNAIEPNDPNFKHVTDEEKQKVVKTCEDGLLWMTKEMAEQDALAKEVDPKLTCNDLIAKRSEITSVCKPIIEKPKPKEEPKKEEPKKEEPKKEEPEPMAEDAGNAEKPAEGTAPTAEGDVEMADTEPKAEETEAKNDSAEATVENGDSVPMSTE